MNALHERSHFISRSALAVAVVAALGTAGTTAGAQAARTTFNIAGGVAIPTGSYTNGLSTGYNVSVGLGMTNPLTPVGFRLEGMYNQEDWQGAGNQGITHRVAAATANLTYDLAGASSSTTGGLYLIGGLGVYGSYDRGGFMDGSPTTTKAGVNGGGGWRLPLTGMNVYLEARYHYIFGTSEQLVPITVGVAF